MGIPRFFYWLYKEYPNVIKNIQDKETFLKHKIEIDTYALDLNAIVHPVCQEVFGYGQYKNGFRQNERLLHQKKYPSKRTECYNKVCEKIEELVGVVKPSKKIIIALDGTAGMSKQYQQRQRRYRSVIENQSNSLSEFDPNEITTGSVFMNELSQCIQEFIKYKISKDFYWKKLDVYFSSEQVPGEGEHKIMNLLKKFCTFGSYCIHSPDADLIMLALSSKCTHDFKNSYIIRENIYKNVYCKYFVVDVNSFSEIIIENFKTFSIKTHNNIFLSDFITFCLFFGNDFLPENPLMLTDKNGIDLLFLFYRETLLNSGNLTCIKNNKISMNIDQCLYFFELLSYNENSLYEKKYKNYNMTLKDFKLNFYKEKLNIVYDDSIQSKKQINKLCQEYLKGIQFVLSYYLYDIPDWYWYYPYHFSPFFSDICNYLKLLKKNNRQLSFQFEKNIPLTPFEQLLAVLPPQSSKILPEPFSDLMLSKNSPIYNFYPEITSLQIEIKNEYEKTILVPFIDVLLLKNTFENTYQDKKELLSNDEINRNYFKETQSFIKKMNYK